MDIILIILFLNTLILLICKDSELNQSIQDAFLHNKNQSREIKNCMAYLYKRYVGQSLHW